MPINNTTPRIEDWPDGSDPADMARLSDSERLDSEAITLQPGLVQVNYYGPKGFPPGHIRHGTPLLP